MFWLGAAVSLCYVPGVTGAYIATQWPFLAIVLSFGLLRRGPFTAFHAVGLLFVAYAIGTAFFSASPSASVLGAWLVIIMACAVWFGTTLEDVRGLYAGLALGGGVSTACALSHFFGYQLLPVTSGAYAGLYVNSVQTGAVFALIIVALASQRMWLHALPLLPGLALAQSRGGWVMLAAGLLACYVRRLWVFAILGVMIAAYLTQSTATSDLERLTIWREAWGNLTWFGHGTGTFYVILVKTFGGVFVFPEYAHNDVLQLAFEYGWAAILPAAVFVYALSRTAHPEWPVIVAFIVGGGYSMPLYMPVTAFLGLVAVGRVLRCYGLLRRDSGSSGLDFIPRVRRGITGARPAAVPLSPNFANEG